MLRKIKIKSNDDTKAMVLWFLGSICILFGALIAGNIEMNIGTSALGYAIGLLAAFTFILAGGLMWISVSINLKA